MLLSVLYFLMTLLLLIFVHESGHFLVGRWCGVKVLRFSFGFGKILAKWQDKQGTEFTLSWLPLGGYVKFLDENEGPVPAKDRCKALNRQPRWVRIAVVFAGSLFNFLFAFLLLWLVAMIGIQSFAPRIASIKPNSIAASAHLDPMQEIIALNGKSIHSWRDVHYTMMPLLGSTRQVSITVKSLDNGRLSTHYLPLSAWAFDAKQSDLLDSLGIVPLFPKLPVLIGSVHADTPAQAAGFLPGDEIIAIDHHAMSDWQTVMQYVRARPGERIAVDIERQGQPRTLMVHLRKQNANKKGFLGINARPPEIPADWLRLERSGPFDAIGRAWHQTISFMLTTVTLLGRTVIGKVSLDHLSGPVGIAKAASESIQLGAVYYLFFIALLSISIGVLNLLPIPLLDGGHLLYEFIEIIIRRPLSKELKMQGIFLGMIVIFLLTLLALYNDLT